MLYGSSHQDLTACPNCGSAKWTACANCVDCGKIICTECKGCDIAEVLTCATCINDLLEASADDEPNEYEPECSCEQVDVDRMDASMCELHGDFKGSMMGGWQ